jgi:ribonucleoside-triphosphate reductase
MRNLEAIETDLAAAREALSGVQGTPAEVYSRIVGYYRSVRNWNKGKREEYGQRVMFLPDSTLLASCMPSKTGEQSFGVNNGPTMGGTVTGNTVVGHPVLLETETAKVQAGDEEDGRVLLFVRPACPACPSAKAAAGRLGIPMELCDADTDEGLAKAVQYQVLSTPTAILLSPNGKELGRAGDVTAIEKLLEKTA